MCIHVFFFFSKYVFQFTLCVCGRPSYLSNGVELSYDAGILVIAYSGAREILRHPMLYNCHVC